uniref:ZAD domain-containing protein n=1 Tax=Heliothis virescens TaxID=7102 RepID=A0A2A4J4I0_HELVI
MDSCRVCMAQNLNMTSIFEAEKENIVDEIQFCTGITITQEAGLPTKICETCLTNLSVAFKFKTSCLVADETFRKIASTLNIKAEELEVSDVEYEEIVECKSEGQEEFEEVVKQEPMEVEFGGKSTLIKVKKSPPPPVKGRPRKTTASLKAPRRVKKFKFKRLWCEPCKMKFETKEESDEHKRSTHNDNWVCEICGKKFVHRASHYTHIKSHQPPKYGCDSCDYKTWHKYDLVKHIRIHTGLKMYQCEYCTASYYTSSNLTSHIRRLHMNEKTHDCNICRRTFFDRTKLNRHLDSHLEIKRFECDVCHACFTRRCYWKKHLLRQHDIVTPPQRPGRQKMNLVIGEYITNKDEIGQYCDKEKKL